MFVYYLIEHYYYKMMEIITRKKKPIKRFIRLIKKILLQNHCYDLFGNNQYLLI